MFPWSSLLSRSRRGHRGGVEGVANLQDPSLILREPPNGNPVLYSFWGLTNLTSDTPPYGKDGQPPGGDGGRVKFAPFYSKMSESPTSGIFRWLTGRNFPLSINPVNFAQVRANSFLRTLVFTKSGENYARQIWGLLKIKHSPEPGSKSHMPTNWSGIYCTVYGTPLTPILTP